VPVPKLVSTSVLSQAPIVVFAMVLTVGAASTVTANTPGVGLLPFALTPTTATLPLTAVRS